MISPAAGPPPLVAVVGPTATGKSGLGVELAAALGGEVVNADAMALYRGMDVGTAKLAPAERAGVPHHLLDVLDVTETASVAAYQRAARAVVEDLRGAGRTPVLVGGSGLYVQAVVDELEFPGTDPVLRAELEAELATVGPAALHTRLAAVDAAAAAAVLPSNGRRIVRALEVVALTGRPFPARLETGGPPRYGAVLLGVDRPTGELDERVARRVARMFACGLVAETRALLDHGLREGRTASRALGYQQVVAALDGCVPYSRGDLGAAAADTVRATRRFVRRQRSWFRRDRRIVWLDPGPDLLGRALRTLESGSMTGIPFTKGHGTQNDFVVLPDPDGTLDLTAARVAALCDRRRGLGADGVLRVVRWAALKDDSFPAEPGVEWFMDYRNADGSAAEMCGNGVRVYAHWLDRAGWLPEADVLRLGTRAGVREVRFTGDGVAVDMGPARVGPASTAEVAARAFAGTAVDVGNPHLACVTDIALDALDLTVAPGYDRALFPHGVNVEFVTPVRDGRVAMRVHERGVGETRSCGTGTVAAVVAALRAAGETTGDVGVQTPGGRLRVTVTADTTVLHGPAVLVASGELDADWWAAL